MTLMILLDHLKGDSNSMNNPVPIIPPRDIMDVCNDVNSRLVFA